MNGLREDKIRPLAEAAPIWTDSSIVDLFTDYFVQRRRGSPNQDLSMPLPTNFVASSCRPTVEAHLIAGAHAAQGRSVAYIFAPGACIAFCKNRENSRKNRHLPYTENSFGVYGFMDARGFSGLDERPDRCSTARDGLVNFFSVH